MKKAVLALADGTVFEGRSFGAEGEAVGEVVFNTSLTGYQEILTDPSYKGQIVTLTYPHIGNYGVNEEDMESARPFAEGLVVREYCPHPSNWRSSMSLGDFLKRHGVVAIEGIDSRTLTQHIRDRGEQVAVLSTLESDPGPLVRQAAEAPGLIGRDLVREVTRTSSDRWRQGEWQRGQGYREGVKKSDWKVVAYDFGVKRNILRLLTEAGCDVTVVPSDCPAEEVLALRPRGLVLSNGPGDPAAVAYAIENTRKLLGKVPIFGICLGHQILGLALGAKTYKLKFGHHGGNHPVMDLESRRVGITAQNHGFAVSFDPLPEDMTFKTPFGPGRVTHVSLNDHTIEGFQCLEVPAFSVQYHPEASPGPHDARKLFDRFVNLMARG